MCVVVVGVIIACCDASLFLFGSVCVCETVAHCPPCRPALKRPRRNTERNRWQSWARRNPIWNHIGGECQIYTRKFGGVGNENCCNIARGGRGEWARNSTSGVGFWANQTYANFYSGPICRRISVCVCERGYESVRVRARGEG